MIAAPSTLGLVAAAAEQTLMFSWNSCVCVIVDMQGGQMSHHAVLLGMARGSWAAGVWWAPRCTLESKPVELEKGELLVAEEEEREPVRPLSSSSWIEKLQLAPAQLQLVSRVCWTGRPDWMTQVGSGFVWFWSTESGWQRAWRPCNCTGWEGSGDFLGKTKLKCFILLVFGFTPLLHRGCHPFLCLTSWRGWATAFGPAEPWFPELSPWPQPRSVGHRGTSQWRQVFSSHVTGSFVHAKSSHNLSW